jgi:hypothetical protein
MIPDPPRSDQPPTPRGDVRGPATRPDAIDRLLGEAFDGQPMTPVLIHSDGIIDTHAGHHHAWIECPYLGPVPLLLPLTAAPLEPLNGYQFNFLGFRIDPALPHDDGPWWQPELQGDRGLVVRFFRQSVRWQYSAIWGSRLTLPNVPPLDLLSGLEQTHTAPEREAAWRGLALLSEHARQRVQTKPAETPEDAWQRLLKAGREACAQWDMDPEQLTHAQLAQAMNRRAPAGRGGRVTDVLARAGRPLNDLKHALEAERREKLEKLQGDTGDDC